MKLSNAKEWYYFTLERLNGAFMKRVLFVLLLPLALAGMQPHDEGCALPPSAKRVCVRAQSPGEGTSTTDQSRAGATLMVINNACRTESIIDSDNGALADQIANSMRSQKNVVLLDSATAIPFLLLSRYKTAGMDAVAEAVPAAVSDRPCEQIAREVLACWDRVIDDESDLDEKVALIKQIRGLVDQDRENDILDIALCMREQDSGVCVTQDCFSAWFALANETPFDQCAVYTLAVAGGSRHFVLLVPHDYIDLGLAFNGCDVLEKQATIFSDEAALKRVLNMLIVEQAHEKVPVTLAFERLFGQGTAYQWNVIFNGHGSASHSIKEQTGFVAGIAMPQFLRVLDFFNTHLARKINMVLLGTCFGGGVNALQMLQHMREKNATVPTNWLLASLSPLDAICEAELSERMLIELDALWRNVTTPCDDVCCEKVFDCFRRLTNVGQILALRPRALEFALVDTHATSDLMLTTPLTNALEDMRAITPASFEIIALAPTFVCPEALRAFLDALEHAPSRIRDARMQLLRLAHARENIFVLISLADAGVCLHALPMTRTLAHRVNEHGQHAARFVSHLSGAQRRALMAWALQDELLAVIAALFGVNPAVHAFNDIVITVNFVRALHDFQPTASDMEKFCDRQLDAICAIAWQECLCNITFLFADGQSDRLTRVYQRFTQATFVKDRVENFWFRWCLGRDT